VPSGGYDSVGSGVVGVGVGLAVVGVGVGVGAAVVGGAVVGVGVGLVVGLVAVVVGAAVVDVGGLVVLRGLGGDPAELRLDVGDVGGTGAPAVVETGATHDTV
jgi:hypothetical protein